MFNRNASYGLSETEFLQLIEGALCRTHSSLQENDSSPSFFGRRPSAQIIGSLEPSRYVPYVKDGQLDALLWRHDARFQAIIQAISDRAEARIAVASSGSNAECASLAQRLDAAASSAEKTGIIREELIEQLVRLLGVTGDSVGTEKPMSLYGFDRLVATELRNWLARTLSVDVTLVQLLSKATRIEDLVRMAAEVNG